MKKHDLCILEAKKVFAEEVFIFEMENRQYFEKYLETRGDEYYSLKKVEQTLIDAEFKRKNDDSYMNLIYLNGELVGRINLHDVKRGEVTNARLGYRVSNYHIGKGIATTAIQIILKIAFSKLGINYLKASTSGSNKASQRVLVKNSFIQTHRVQRELLINNNYEDCLYYRCGKYLSC